MFYGIPFDLNASPWRWKTFQVNKLMVGFCGDIGPRKFAKALQLDPGEYLSVDGELLSLAQTFTLSLWAKILMIVLASGRNGQFPLNTMMIISFAVMQAQVAFLDANTRLPSGRWVHYILTYDSSNVRLYFDGQIVAETAHSGYLSWGDGGDHNLYLNRYATAGWEAKAIYDDLRVYNRSLTSSEIGLLWSSGAGDQGVSPLVSGADPFYQVPSPYLVSFLTIINPSRWVDS